MECYYSQVGVVGGSAQMLVRDAATGAYGICNKPSDGAERPVIDGWAVMKRM